VIVSPRARRTAALLAAAVAWVWSWWALLVGLLWGLALRCDEACTGDGWRHTEDAWQWNLVAGAGVAAFCAGLALVLFVGLRRPRAASAALIVEALCGAALAAALAPGWWDHLDSRNVRPLALTAAAGACAVGAVLLSSRPGERA
jgi:hypothetical protein